jgi:AbrB family looped-hinge helix DNA binding protein
MRITSKGQVAIPLEVRRRAGFLPGTDVMFVMDGDEVKLVKVTPELKPSRRVKQIQEWIKRVRGTATTGLTTDEIMEMTRGPRDGSDPARV